MGEEGPLPRSVRWAGKGIWQELLVTMAAAGGPPSAVLIDSTHLNAHRSAAGEKGGAFAQAIGISRGGRSSKPYALTDGEGRPFRFLLTPKNVAHARAALQLLNALPLHAIVLAYRAYDGGAIRALIEEQGAVPNIPPKITASKKLLLQGTLPGPQRHRENVLSSQELAPHRHPLRRARNQHHCRYLPRFHGHLLIVMVATARGRDRDRDRERLKPANLFHPRRPGQVYRLEAWISCGRVVRFP